MHETGNYETQGSGSFYSDNEVTYANNGSFGAGYYDSKTGTGIYAGSESQPLGTLNIQTEVLVPAGIPKI